MFISGINDGNERYRSDIVRTARDENNDNDNDNDTDVDKDVDVDEVVTTAQITKTTTVEPLKKKGGRPPKIHSALVISPVKIVKKWKIKTILVEKRSLPKRQCKIN